MSAYRSMLENVLDTADIVRDGDFSTNKLANGASSFILTDGGDRRDRFRNGDSGHRRMGILQHWEKRLPRASAESVSSRAATKYPEARHIEEIGCTTLGQPQPTGRSKTKDCVECVRLRGGQCLIGRVSAFGCA